MDDQAQSGSIIPRQKDIQLRWKKPGTVARSGKMKGVTYSVPPRPNPDHASMSQRKYKVRFRSDMRKEDSIQLNRRSRCPKPETIGSKDSTIIRCMNCMNCMNCNDCQTSSPIASTDHQMECDLNGVENTSTLNEGENPPGLEDAAILLAFSAGDTSNEFSCDDPSNPVSPFISQERSHRRNPQEDSSTNPSHQQCNLILNPSSSSPITKTTPQLTFQTDILPNIPRALSSF